MQTVSVALWQQVIIAAGNYVIPLAVAAALGYVTTRAVKYFPALGAFLTAARVKQGEDAISNMAVADLAKAVPGTLTVSDAVAKRIEDASAALKFAMAANGTSVDQLHARVVGNVLTSATSIPSAAVPARQ